MKKPSKMIEVTISDTKVDINYPKSGEFIDIAVLKAKLSQNQYNAISLQSSIESALALRLIDVYSFLNVMTPNVKEFLSTKSFYDIDTADAMELIHVYDSEINPWLDQWTEYINHTLSELRGKKIEKDKLI